MAGVVAPRAGLAVPGGQGAQVGSPAWSAYRPEGHGLQTRAALPEKVPLGQAGQALAASRLEFVPGAQLPQEEFAETPPGSALNVPGPQRVGEEAEAGQGGVEEADDVLQAAAEYSH